MCVCVFVCYHEIYFMPRLYMYVKTSVLGFFIVFCCVAFAENTLLKSSGVICLSPLLSLLPIELLKDRRDRDGIFLTKLVCRYSKSPYNTTDLSLIIL